MKLIIQNNQVAATATDAYVPTGTEQDIVYVPDGTDITNYVYVGSDLETAKANMFASLEKYRLNVQNSGLTYKFPDGIGTIQTRDPIQYPDIAIINGQATSALILAQQNVTTAFINFRDEENVTHSLTPTQTITMALAVSKFVSDTYAAKWAKQVEISNLTEENYQSYDMTAGWPTT